VRPEFRLLDARAAGVAEPGLRDWARAESSAACKPYSSHSYRFPYALVAWHDEPVGVDIERSEPVCEGFLGSICTPSEHGLRVDPISLWCSKEALAKALGDALSYDPRRLESPIFWPQGRSGPWQAAALAAPQGHRAWLCWRSSCD
jgi:phosphopantetheinyl transferase